MKKVLIITYSFPPLNNIAARRFGDISKYLATNGWEPFILTTNSTGPLEVTVTEENIFRVGTHPQKGSEIGNQISIKKNLKSVAMDLKRATGFNLRLIDRAYIDWYKQILKMDIELLKKQNFDMIIASYGPGASLFAGSHLSKKLNVPWIADFRDLGALYKDDRIKKNFLFKNLDLAIEKKLLKSASAITTVSHGLKNEFCTNYNIPAHVIYNGWEKSMDNTNEILKKSEIPYIYYAGRFYEHRMESLFILIKSLKSSELNLKIRSLGPEQLNKKIIAFVSEMGLADKVEMLSPAKPEIVDKESASAVINLVIEDLDKSFQWKKGTLTGKFLSLLIKQSPILAIARDDSEIGEILIETGKGKLCSDEEEVRNYLEKYKSFGESINEKLIMFYSKEKQAALLSRILDNTIIDKRDKQL